MLFVVLRFVMALRRPRGISELLIVIYIRVSPNDGLANGSLSADLFRFLLMFLKLARYLAS